MDGGIKGAPEGGGGQGEGRVHRRVEGGRGEEGCTGGWRRAGGRKGALEGGGEGGAWAVGGGTGGGGGQKGGRKGGGDACRRGNSVLICRR